MSYRSIKRVLGETSLERKCRFLFGACLLLLITASFWWTGSQTEGLVTQRNRDTGRLLVDQVMSIEHWEKLETFDEFKPVVRDLTEKLSNQEYYWRFIRPDGNVSGGRSTACRSRCSTGVSARWPKIASGCSHR